MPYLAGVITPQDYGAAGNGTTDDTSAMQSAVSAAVSAGGTLYLPAGSTFLISSPISVTGAFHLLGSGVSGATILSAASGIFDFGGTYITGLEFDHFAVDCTGGPIFTNLNLHRGYFHHLKLTQRSGSEPIATLGAAGGGLSSFTVADIEQYLYPDPTTNVRSIAGWSLYDGTGSGKNIDVVDIVRTRTICEANAAGSLDNTQFVFDIACTVAGPGGLADRVSFLDCDFGQCLGGAIRLLSVQGAVIDRAGVGNVYTQAGVSIGNSMIYVGQYSGAAVSENPLISGYVRENSGTEALGSHSDIEVDAATVGTTVIAPTGTGASTNPPIAINLNGAAGASIINPPSNATITNPASDTVITGNGTVTVGGTALAKTPAAAVNAAPAAPAGTVSTTRVMMGLGSTCTYTPASTGKVLVLITAAPYVLTGAVYGLISALYGTGAAPANGTAETGTAMPGMPANTRPAVNGATTPATFVSSAVLTLTPGTTYWFDLALATSNTADEYNLENVVMSFAELP